jgi:chaperonin GroES
MLRGNELPAMPNNDRIIVRPDPPKDRSEGGIIIPETSKEWATKGILVHAGLKARDIMYDHGHEMGDRIWFGQFAGVWQEWDHVTEEGSDVACEHGDWRTLGCDLPKTYRRKCGMCGAIRTQEPIFIMNAEDILANETAEERRRKAEMGISRGRTEDGATMHVIVRPGDKNMTTTLEGTNVIAQ